VIGDVGMILGTFVLFVQFHAITYAGVFRYFGVCDVCTRANPNAPFVRGDSGMLELAAFLLLVGAVAKSAQLPLHTWLPDAMEGPTPVSALIHAATMVTAGVYLVGRMHPIYDLAVYAHGAVAIIGAVTALFAATIAIVQTDIKRVLAYSTMSQIGYMFLAVGIGAYSAGFFHLLSHAFFKALLFMAAGNVIHAMHDEQDMRKYGGLWNDMRPTAITFLVGSLSLVGVIPFVGFFSKEQILGLSFAKGDPLTYSVWAIGFVTALVTGFYTGRTWWMSFWGKPSPDRPVEHPHAPALVMMVPVAILAVLATVGGLLQTRTLGFGTSVVSDFLGAQSWDENGGAIALGLLTMLIAAALFVGAIRIRPWTAVVPWAQRLLEHKYYFDELYDAAFVRPMDWVAGFAFRDVEKPVIDAAVVDTGRLTQWTSVEASRNLQTGYFRNYVLVFVVGVVAIGGGLVIIRALS
jgi:NADH-quinone oxidoreductase subunit L